MNGVLYNHNSSFKNSENFHNISVGYSRCTAQIWRVSTNVNRRPGAGWDGSGQKESVTLCLHGSPQKRGGHRDAADRSQRASKETAWMHLRFMDASNHRVTVSRGIPPSSLLARGKGRNSNTCETHTFEELNKNYSAPVQLTSDGCDVTCVFTVHDWDPALDDIRFSTIEIQRGPRKDSSRVLHKT